jgi:hypothetical protein
MSQTLRPATGAVEFGTKSAASGDLCPNPGRIREYAPMSFGRKFNAPQLKPLNLVTPARATKSNALKANSAPPQMNSRFTSAFIFDEPLRAPAQPKPDDGLYQASLFVVTLIVLAVGALMLKPELLQIWG